MPALRLRARLLRIEDTRHDEAAFLEAALASSSSRVRSLAALAAGRIGGTMHRPALRRLASGRDAQVAADAIFALALLRDTASLQIGMDGLHREPLVAIQGARLLGEIGEPARRAIVSALADSALDSSTRGAVLLAAARLRPVPAPSIAPWVGSLDGEVAWRAAYALSRGRSPAGVRTLLGVARSTNAAVREQAARGLGRAVAGDSLADAAVAALHVLAADAEPHVRVNAVRALASWKAAGRDDVVRAIHDADPAVRLTAAQGLDAVLDSSSATWDDALHADTAFVVQQAVADGAVRRGLGTAIVGEWHRSGEWLRRAAAARLETVGAAPGAVPKAAGWTHDADARVRLAAVEALARLADSASVRPAARKALRVQLEDEDFTVRAAALSGLAHGADAGDLAAAMESYRAHGSDHAFDARLAFWQLADSALRRSPALPDSIDRALGALPLPADPLERAAAAAIPRFAAWKDAPVPARPLAWYEQRAREASRRRAPVARIETERGAIELQLHGADAPLTVYNFVSLARAGYFDGQRFHRVVPDFVVQAGDPRGDGNGGPGYAIRDEINPHPYQRGTLGMALSGRDTGGSQFFVTHSPQPHLDGGYTVFGQLLQGGDVLDRIVQGDHIVRITIR